jgi:heterodisulfide reductase subunit A
VYEYTSPWNLSNQIRGQGQAGIKEQDRYRFSIRRSLFPGCSIPRLDAGLGCIKKIVEIKLHFIDKPALPVPYSPSSTFFQGIENIGSSMTCIPCRRCVRRLQRVAEDREGVFMAEKAKKSGSVMVVGAGIAGMQSALDLAESGYYVYLVEKSSAIGGLMSQLDKTFPTNDCAM